MNRSFCPSCLTPLAAHEEACPSCAYSRPDAGWPLDEHIGRLVNGKYLITGRLGEGGFGMVFRGRQMHGETALGDVALKMLHPHLASNASARRRFRNEVRAARSIDSPHAVKIYDFGFDEQGIPFIAMELLTGEPLSAVRESRMPPVRVLRLGMQMARTLQECHGRGILHLDLKPQNIFLQKEGDGDFVKIIDFGIARIPDSQTSLTIAGTPQYMPPEQILGQKVDGGVDIYALGIILFECLTGKSPLQSPAEDCTPLTYLRHNVKARPLSLRAEAPDLPSSLENLLGSMVAKQREARPPSMADVEARLKAIGMAEGWLPEYGRPSLPAPTRSYKKPQAASLAGGRLRVLLVILLGLALLGGLLGYMLFAYRGKPAGGERDGPVPALPEGARAKRPEARAKKTEAEARAKKTETEVRAEKTETAETGEPAKAEKQTRPDTGARESQAHAAKKAGQKRHPAIPSDDPKSTSRTQSGVRVVGGRPATPEPGAKSEEERYPEEEGGL